jgi:hypothetical protein
MFRARSFLGSVLLASALGAAGCQSAGFALAKLMPGTINDPKNRTMRREMLKFGQGEFCKELLRHGAPLKLRDDAPAVGRFFADQCDYRELDNDDAFVQVSGQGYAWSQATGRVGFRAAGSIQYNPDFLLEGSAMYAYFRPRNVQSTQFTSLMIEKVQQNPLGGLFGGTAQDIAGRLGNQIVAQELTRGFTVIRDDDGSVDFGLGIIEQGKRPFHPYQVKGSDKVLLASDWSEIHEQQREFLGPFDVSDDKQALFFTLSLDGVPAVDLLLFRKEVGDVWRRELETKPGTTPPAQAPILADVLTQQRGEWRRTVPLPKGSYYLVVDHTSTAGSVAPPPGQAGVLSGSDLAAVVRYVAQLGAAP